MNNITNLPGRTARVVTRRPGTAGLATAAAGADGWPHVSLVAVALDQDGAPLLLLSRLAEHTSNIAGDARVSLLFSVLPGVGGDPSGVSQDPLSGSRVTVVGHARPSPHADHRRRFLARHPEAAQYADFGDFSFYRVEVARVHLVAGFGDIHWIDGRDFLVDEGVAAKFAASESSIIDRLNEGGLDAGGVLAAKALAAPGHWDVTGCDPDGLDLFETVRGAWARIDFDPPATDPEAVRTILATAKGASGGTVP